MAARPRRRGGSGSDNPSAQGAPSSGPNVALIGIAAVVLVGVGVGAAVLLKGGGGDPAPPAGAPVTLAVEDPFVSVPRAGADLGGNEVQRFDEKLGEDTFTLAIPKSFSVRVGSLAEGKKDTFRNRDKSAVVWVVGALKGAVTTTDLLREIQIDPSSRTEIKPQSQRLGSVVGSGERFTVPLDPEPLEGIVLRAPYGTDREVMALGVAPSRVRAVVDAMLGSLRCPKLQGPGAVGGVTYLPK